MPSRACASASALSRRSPGLYDAVFAPYELGQSGPAIAAIDLAVVLAWGLIGAFIAWRWFRWSPARS